MKFIRTSKFRHVFANPSKQELCFVGTKLTKTAWDANFVKCSSKQFAMVWETQGGGSFAVFNYDQAGKLANVPLVNGHKNPVLDIDWNPFNEELIASASEDCNVCIWGIPTEGLKDTLTTPLQTLTGHKRKVGSVNFHPCANNVLATSAGDFSVKLWDIEKADELFSVAEHTDIISSVSFNKNGSQIATACKDKKLRILDPRDKKVVAEVVSHQGTKGIRAIWMNDRDKIFTIGFTKTSEREFCIWDPKNLEAPLGKSVLDSQSGTIMPFYDQDTGIMFLGGKGESNIRYYEMSDEKPFFYFLSEYKSTTPQIGLACVPKRACNVATNEIARFYKATKDRVEPLSFTVPRKSDIFQDDIFPSCYAGASTISLEEWKNGGNADPDSSFSMAPGFVAPEKPKEEFQPLAKEVEKPKSDKEMQEENETLKKRVAFLESEMIKKDALIKSLQEKPAE